MEPMACVRVYTQKPQIPKNCILKKGDKKDQEWKKRLGVVAKVIKITGDAVK